MADTYYLSYLMGGEKILDSELEDLNIKIVGRTENGHRELKVPPESLAEYIELVKDMLTEGFWNEIVGEDQILFIFKFKDGEIKEFTLNLENEAMLDKLCAEFNNQQSDKYPNVYKWLSENSFYHDFMLEYYSNLINRNF